MKRILIRIGIAVMALGFSLIAGASFHLWRISEIYSNASGTIQFIELSTTAGGQQSLAGHSITASGANTNNFVFPSNLPGDSAFKRFLIGTQGFATLGIVTPDYVVPNGFLSLNNGTVNFAGVDSVTYVALPTDGTNSIDPNGSPGTNSPTNFAGQTGTVPGGPVITPPGAPTITTAVPGNGQAALSFTAPASNGGATITTYTANCGQGSTPVSANALQLTVTGLTNGVTYSCTVSATNSAGPGQASIPAQVTPGVATLSILTSPINFGGVLVGTSPTQNIVVRNTGTAASSALSTGISGVNAAQFSPQSDACNAQPLAAMAQCNVTMQFSPNAVGAFSATFNVTATAGGTANLSMAGNGITAPSAPSITSVAPGSGQATVNFTPPASDGGSAIAQYTASCGGITKTGQGSPLIVTGLTNGMSTACSVFATNAAGNGPPSASQNVTPAGLPGAPTGVTATPGNAQASIFYTAPANNGSPISGFTATCNPGNKVGTGVTSPINVGMLTNGTSYSCVVTATNGVGIGPASLATTVTPATAPDAPTIGVPINADSKAYIAFTPPAANGGSAITSYTATCSPGNVTGSGMASPILVTPLGNGNNFNCNVLAINAIGTSQPSADAIAMPTVMPTLALVSVKSRKVHGGTPYDIDLDRQALIGGNVTIEPRTIGNGHTIVFQFNNTVTFEGTANATVGTAIPAPVADTVVVTLLNVRDKQRLTLQLNGVNNTFSDSVSIGFLVGDVNNSYKVNASDIASVKARNGQLLSTNNFRFDLNAIGGISSADTTIVKSRAGNVLP